MKKQKKKTITAEEFDKKFDNGEDVTEYLDLDHVRVNNPAQRVNIDIPMKMVQKLNLEAIRIGVTRTALIKLWIAERLDKLSSAPPPAA